MSRLIVAACGTLVLLADLPLGQAAEIIARGTLVGASDHVTTGLVEIVKDGDTHVVRLADDFSLDGAPDPKLGFGNDGTYDTSTTFAPLEKLTGAQVYTLPASIDPTVYGEFYVWCEQFSVPLGVATLQ